MADATEDPAGNTDQFKAFVHRDESPVPPSRVPLIVGSAVAVAVVLAVTLFVLLG